MKCLYTRGGLPVRKSRQLLPQSKKTGVNQMQPYILFIFQYYSLFLLNIYRNTNSMNHSTLTPYESIASLGASFAKYRKSLKISQQRLHEKTGISIFTISQFENGKGQGLSLSHFLLLLDAVGLDISLTNLIPIASVIDPEKIWKSQNRKGGRK